MRPGTGALHARRLDWVGPVARGGVRGIRTHRLLEWKGTAGCTGRDRHHPTRRWQLSSVASAGRARRRDPLSLSPAALAATPSCHPDSVVSSRLWVIGQSGRKWALLAGLLIRI